MGHILPRCWLLTAGLLLLLAQNSQYVKAQSTATFDQAAKQAGLTLIPGVLPLANVSYVTEPGFAGIFVAPSDDTIKKAVVELSRLSPEKLTDILLYHILPNGVLPVNGTAADIPTSLPDHSVKVSVMGTNVSFDGVSATSCIPYNAAAVLCKIEMLLIPAVHNDAVPSPSSNQTGTIISNTTVTLNEALVEEGLTQLPSLVQLSNLTGIANDSFVGILVGPSNAAIAAGLAQLANFTAEDKRAVLAYHILPDASLPSLGGSKEFMSAVPGLSMAVAVAMDGTVTFNGVPSSECIPFNGGASVLCKVETVIVPAALLAKYNGVASVGVTAPSTSSSSSPSGVATASPSPSPSAATLSQASCSVMSAALVLVATVLLFTC